MCLLRGQFLTTKNTEGEWITGTLYSDESLIPLRVLREISVVNQKGHFYDVVQYSSEPR